MTALRAVQPIQAALQRFSQHPQATYLERCVAAGLLAYTFQYPRLQMPNMFHDPSIQGFVRLFSLSYRASSNVERNVLMWAQMAVEGFVSCRTSRLPGSREIFERALTKYENMRDWKRLESVLQRYFCTLQGLERWQACHAGVAKTSVFETSPMTPSSLVTVETVSATSDPDIQSAGVCPFSGRIANSAEGELLLCPFRPGAS